MSHLCAIIFLFFFITTEKKVYFCHMGEHAGNLVEDIKHKIY